MAHSLLCIREPMAAEIIRFHAAPKAIYLAGTAPPRPTFSEAELTAAERAAYQSGADESRAMLEGAMLEMRAEVIRLQGETFAALTAQHAALAEQFAALLPEWAGEAVRRILAATPIEGETVRRIVSEMLAEIEPGREAVEVRLHAADLKAIESFESSFREMHPAIAFVADGLLAPGDCVVRSRFGTLDGRLRTKLETIEEVLRG